MIARTFSACFARTSGNRRIQSIPFFGLALSIVCLTPFVPHAAPGPAEFLVASQEGSTSSAEQVSSGQDPRVGPELSAELQRWLDQVRELQMRGDFNGARAHFSGLIWSDVFVELLASVDDVALVGLERIDEMAELHGHLDTQVLVRKERLQRLSASLKAGHVDLLEAERRLEETRRRLTEPARPADVEGWLNGVRELQARGDSTGAVELLSALLSNLAYVELLASTDDVVEASLDEIDELAGNLGLQRIPISTQKERIRRRSASLGSDDLALHLARLKLARLLYSSGDREAAHKLLETGHEALVRLLPANHQDVLAVKSNLATVREVLGDSEGALELQETVLAARERMLPSDAPLVVSAKLSLAMNLRDLGHLARALDLNEQAHTAREQSLPADHPDLLKAKHSLALTLKQLGDFAGALELEEYVYAAHVRAQPQDLRLLLNSKNNLALTRQALGDLAGALELQEQVHEAEARMLPVDVPRLLRAKQNLATTRKALGDLAGAHELNLQVHAAWERLVPPDHPSLLDAKHNLAGTLKQLGHLAEAHELIKFVHAVHERSLPPEHPDLLDSKLNIAVMRKILGDLNGALQLEEHVHAIRETRLPPDHPKLLKIKQNLASTREALGDLSGALALIEVVHTARERLLPPDHPDLLGAKLSLARLRRRLGDLTGAHELHEWVHAARERLLPADHPDLLETKLSLATTRKELGDLAGGLQLLEYVHSARERLLPEDHPDLLNARYNLAAVRWAMGDLAGAEELFERVHEAWDRSLPPDHPSLLSAKLSLAVARLSRGDLAGSLELTELVLRSQERLLPDDHPDLLSAKMNLAVTRYSLGDISGAKQILELVLSARERLLPRDHPDLLFAQQNLAAIRFSSGEYSGALELLEVVHEAYKRSLPADHPDRLRTEQNIAAARYELGDHAGAKELLERSLAASEDSLPPNHPELLSSKQIMAGLRHSLGDLAGALELLEQVYAARSRSLPPDHPKLLFTMEGLAWMRQEQGDHASALTLVSSILRGQDQRSQSFRLDAPRVARAKAEGEVQRLSRILSLDFSDESIDASGIESGLFLTLENLRSVSVAAGRVRRATSERPELAELLEALEHTRGAIGDHWLSPPASDETDDEPRVDSWREELFKLTEERDELEKRVRVVLANAGFSTVSPTAQRVAGGLSTDAVLIDFLRYDKESGIDPPIGQKVPIVQLLLAFVVTANGEVMRVELGRSDELEQMVLEWRALIGKPMERGVLLEISGESEFELGSRLRARLLDPCLAVLEGTAPAELHVILDDFLHLLPVDALPWTEEERLGEVFAIRQETSAQRLADADDQFRGDGVLLAMGGVDFAAKNIAHARKPFETAAPPTGASNRSSRSSRPEIFSALIQTRLEVETLGLLHQELTGGESVVLTKMAASKKALFEHAPSARYLHLATHGWFASETFVSTLDSTEGQRPSSFAVFSRTDETVLGFAPETLCGLALAGANHGVNSAGRVPGIITAEELGALDLSGCELAVLSACETNVGLRRAGQGIQSLQTALHAAGARTAITSLWRVDDAATRRLMELFYTKLWSEELGKADALWQAKMALRREGYQLKDWAAWVLTGDPR